MSDDCCVEIAGQNGSRRCPRSDSVGQPVKWTTMVALSAVPIPPRQAISLCLDQDCEVVYFGDRGLELRRADLHTVPGFKVGDGDLVCYCFHHSRTAIEQEVRTLSSSPTVDEIRRQVKEKNCACEVRNPTGKCCLRDVQQIIEETSMKGTSP